MMLHSYDPTLLARDARLVHASRHRVIEHQDRWGLHLPGIRERFILPEHSLNAARGTLTLWVLPLDDLFPQAHYEQHKLSYPFSDRFVFLSDREAVGDVGPAQFCLYYDNGWHPVFIAKFHQGDRRKLVWAETQGAIAMSGHFEFHRLHWYQLAVTWDREKSLYRVYANGVLVAHTDATYEGRLLEQPCGPMLYGGNPALAYSTIEFHESVLSSEELKEKYRTERPADDPRLDQMLSHTYEGVGLPAFQFSPDQSWRHRLDVPFQERSDLLLFHHQGAINDLRFEEGGLRIRTPPMIESLRRADAPRDMTRMYLWSRDAFEGDLYVRVEFKPMQHGGLALLMTQAAGMQGESFLRDYFLRTDGSMQMVCWEDVRNYHWEFYREMVDVRNDLISHACLKNPWYKPMSFQVENRRWEMNRWYVLEYLQEGPRLRGALDGVTVMDVCDTGFDNNGPVLLHGHIALRCMMRTDVVFRGLTVWDRPHVREVTKPLTDALAAATR
jgi:hypothetical protein